MASQPVRGREDITSSEVQSYMRGYHAWTFGTLSEVLLLKCEPNNSKDRFTVAIKRTGSAVSHIPFNLASLVLAFLGVISTRD